MDASIQLLDDLIRERERAGSSWFREQLFERTKSLGESGWRWLADCLIGVPNVALRADLATAAGRLGQGELARPLRQLLRLEGHPRVRAAVVGALARIGTEEALEALEELRDRPEGKTADLTVLEEAIKECCRRIPVERHVKRFGSGAENKEECHRGAVRLAAAGTDEAIRALASFLKGAEPVQRREAAAALGSTGAAAAYEPVLRGYRQARSEYDEAVLTADAKSSATLLGVVAAAITALGQLSGSTAERTTYFLNLTRRIIDEDGVKLFRLAAAEAMQYLRGGETWALVARLARHPDAETRVRAVKAVACHHAAQQGAVIDLLVERAGDESVWVRREAIAGLGSLEAGRDHLLAMLEHTDWRCQASALEILAKIGDRRAAAAVCALLGRSAHARVVPLAMEALGRLGGSEAAELLARRLDSKHDLEEVGWIAAALRGVAAPEALEALVQAVRDTGRHARERQVCLENTMAFVRDPLSRRFLSQLDALIDAAEALIDSEDRSLRQAAIGVLADLDCPDLKIMGRVRAILASRTQETSRAQLRIKDELAALRYALSDVQARLYRLGHPEEFDTHGGWRFREQRVLMVSSSRRSVAAVRRALPPVSFRLSEHCTLEEARAAVDPDAPPDYVLFDECLPGDDSETFLQAWSAFAVAFGGFAGRVVPLVEYGRAGRLVGHPGVSAVLEQPVRVCPLLDCFVGLRPRPALVCDDSAFIRKILRRILEHLGYEVVAEAGNGEEAIRFYRRFSPDLAILDIEMAGIDGLAALAEILHLDPMAAVIMISSFQSASNAELCLRQGARAFLAKPFDPARAGETIVNVLDRHPWRRHPRVRVSEKAPLPVRAYGSGGRAIEGRIVEVSIGGLTLECEGKAADRPAMGEHIRVSLRVGPSAIGCDTVVAASTPELLVLALENPTERAQEAIARYVLERLYGE
ncbi:MAG: HEAT repeat domain-containing protein [Candidatus Schekmanbacteria bacterium]|nr:HEAT repeat domain-containing protein [Candidatus Schekmanbacteria bacterium]